MEAIKTTITTENMSMETADEIINGMDLQVEEYEKNVYGHVYTLSNGSCVIISFHGVISTFGSDE